MTVPQDVTLDRLRDREMTGRRDRKQAAQRDDEITRRAGKGLRSDMTGRRGRWTARSPGNRALGASAFVSG